MSVDLDWVGRGCWVGYSDWVMMLHYRYVIAISIRLAHRLRYGAATDGHLACRSNACKPEKKNAPQCYANAASSHG